MNMTLVGKRIQAARRRKGITQTQLAEMLDMTAKYISNVECGTKCPKLETFLSIANILEVDANTLLVDVLKVSDEVQCSALWKTLETLPTEKRQKAMRMLELFAEEP